MRVLLINQFYLPDVAATGQLLGDVGSALAGNGHEVHVVCSQGAYGGGRRLPTSEETINGVRVHRVGASGFGRGTVLGRLVDYASFYLLAVWRVLTLPRMDVCVCLTTPPFIALAGVLLRRLRGTRLVLWTMDLYPEIMVADGVIRSGGIVHRLLARLAKWTYRRTEQILSLGEIMTKRLVAAGAAEGQVLTVDNWVPGESVSAMEPGESRLRREWRLDGRLVLMYSGNLGLGHQLDTVVQALGLLCGEAAMQAVFVGNGKMRPVLEEMVADMHLEGVRFFPPQPLADLGECLAAGDIHIVAQRPGTEGVIVPSKIYGILAAGRPVVFVGSEGCEVARILRESQAGVVTPPTDVRGLAETVRRLASNPALRRQLGRNARHHYETRLGRDRSLERITAAIQAAGDRPRQGGTKHE